MRHSRSFQMMGIAGAAMLLLGACSSGTPEGGTEGPGEGGDVLRLAMNSAEDHPIYLAMDSFAQELDETTDGRWTLEIYPNETLGAQQETMQLVSDGTLDMAVVSSAQMESFNPDFVVFNIPGVFDSEEHLMAVINDEEIVGDLYSSLEDQNITVLGGLNQGARSVYTTYGPVESPEDLNGKKFRVQESDLLIDMMDLMGGAATPMSYGEVYTALQSGVLDGAENNEASYASSKHYEIAPYYSYTRHQLGIDYVLMSTEALQGMSDEDRSTFTALFADAVELQAELQDETRQDAIAEAEAGGATFYEIDNAPFLAALEPLAEKYLTTETSRELYEATRAVAE